jgi:hypothetical protein
MYSSSMVLLVGIMMALAAVVACWAVRLLVSLLMLGAPRDR